MRASEVLQNLVGSLWALDARLVRRVLGAVDALVACRQVVLMELARQYPGASHVSAPLKALDRLLSSLRWQAAREHLYAALWSRLWPRVQAVLAVDWSTLKRDESWHLLRAAVTVGGRALPVWDEVHPQADYNSPRTHKAFLLKLRQLLPQGMTTTLLTDAGFGVPWFRAAEAQGFACIGRLRGWTQNREPGAPSSDTRGFDALPPQRTLDLGECEIGKTRGHLARVIVHRRPPQGRKHTTLDGRTALTSGSRAQARSAREAWVLIVSCSLAHVSASEIVHLYVQRMQIEESFRDLKSARYGAALSHSKTRSAARLASLILLHAMTSIAAWLRGLLAHETGQQRPPLAHPQAARRPMATLSLWRIGWELLKRHWPPAVPQATPYSPRGWCWLQNGS